MELTATVEISLAFHVWYSLSIVETSKDTLELWKVLLHSYVPHIAVKVLDTDEALQSFVHLPAVFPMSAGANTAQPCLCLLQLLLLCHHVPSDNTLAGYTKQIKRTAAGLQTSHKLTTKSKNRLYVLRLQQKVLVMKLAELLASVKQRASSAELASVAMWQYLAEELHDDEQILPISPNPPPNHTAQPGDVETELVYESHLLMQLLIGLMQVLSRQASSHHSLAMCLTVIQQIPYRQPQCSTPSVLYVDHEMINQGKLMQGWPMQVGPHCHALQCHISHVLL